MLPTRACCRLRCVSAGRRGGSSAAEKEREHARAQEDKFREICSGISQLRERDPKDGESNRESGMVTVRVDTIAAACLCSKAGERLRPTRRRTGREQRGRIADVGPCLDTEHGCWCASHRTPVSMCEASSAQLREALRKHSQGPHLASDEAVHPPASFDPHPAPCREQPGVVVVHVS
eukprot:3465418-Rhodomonas_salina.1